MRSRGRQRTAGLTDGRPGQRPKESGGLELSALRPSTQGRIRHSGRKSWRGYRGRSRCRDGLRPGTPGNDNCRSIGRVQRRRSAGSSRSHTADKCCEWSPRGMKTRHSSRSDTSCKPFSKWPSRDIGRCQLELHGVLNSPLLRLVSAALRACVLSVSPVRGASGLPFRDSTLRRSSPKFLL
jgi:hypothetical protein